MILLKPEEMIKRTESKVGSDFGGYNLIYNIFDTKIYLFYIIKIKLNNKLNYT
ncbi:hypothetical protein BJV85_000377 [Clostridium acetobutylicum]|uniref:hypothetical protein n=1 Tax=Clostridium acetobutylicum TaxID=1488 RepID=UPI000200BF9B|nr:hypothetical protein [Clostridium acetobutylicum]ADZ22567.1 permease [Clostridium acetobutylicum EA 2018]AEI32908.1 permease [Clostridium acetobutylicum DSM 1731]PSM05466.1 permease [Clostridium sp. NJ4]AWV80878.1 permease [Clostridium acetobutylicum]MBC2393794.1 permease [Clostridium acetobutylicum]